MLVVGGMPAGAHAQELTAEAPEVMLAGIPFAITVNGVDADSLVVVIRGADGRELARQLGPGATRRLAGIVISRRAELPLAITAGSQAVMLDRRLLPGWITIVPPLLAIGLALIAREVVSSLFLGVFVGALFLVGYDPVEAITMSVGRFARDALSDGDHTSIVIFSLLLGGMVGVLSRMGATTAIVDAVAPIATNRRRGQLATWAAGLAIFFDDYSNTLIVGNTMRPLTDRLRISREKLAYIVDSTAAPVAALAFISTWVGFEISLIDDGLRFAGARGAAPAVVTPFAIFIKSIPYLHYPILAVLLVFLVAVLRRDFGPMLTAERRAAAGGGVSRPGAQLTAGGNELGESAARKVVGWWAGGLPVLAVIVVVVAGLVHTGLASLPPGSNRDLATIFGHADPYTPLLWGSLVGCIVALFIAVLSRALPLAGAIAGWLAGVRAMVLAIVILVLAWSLGAVTAALGAPSFLSALLSERLPVEFLPATVFTVAAVISFATGTSWSTMTILFPLVVPLAITMGGAADPGQPAAYQLLASTVAAVMGGALFGDHCSPISDTTVMSSMASGCDHLDHVRTQTPYALLVAVVAVLVGMIPAGFGISPWISLAAGAALVLIVIWVVGKPVADTG